MEFGNGDVCHWPGSIPDSTPPLPCWDGVWEWGGLGLAPSPGSIPRLHPLLTHWDGVWEYGNVCHWPAWLHPRLYPTSTMLGWGLRMGMSWPGSIPRLHPLLTHWDGVWEWGRGLAPSQAPPTTGTESSTSLDLVSCAASLSANTLSGCSTEHIRLRRSALRGKVEGPASCVHV